MDIKSIIDSKILPHVQKPARYIGGEQGSIKKEFKKFPVRLAFCFPETYEIPAHRQN